MTDRRELDTRFASADESPGFLLWRVTNQWQATIRRALAEFGLTHVQFVLLAALTWSGEPAGITQAALARTTRSDPMMVSQVIRALEAKRLVERRRDGTDARAIRVVATGDGKALAARANTVVEEADAAFFGDAAGRQLTLVEHLRRVDGGRRNT